MNALIRKTMVFVMCLILATLAACASTTLIEQKPAGAPNPVNAGTTPKSQPVNNEPSMSNAIERAQRVSFESPDKTTIVGSFYQSSQPRSPTVLLLHQWGSNRQSYNEFAKRLQGKGFNALAIDGRGFGESTKQADLTIAPSRTAEAVAGMLADLKAALDFLKTQPNVDSSRIAIVGASYGSSLAIIYAAGNADVKAVALLSPGTNYFGNLPTEAAIQKYGSRPLLIVAAEDDKESADAARKLDRLATGDKHGLKIYPRGGHGTGIFAAGVGLENDLENFLTDNL